jgi:hypothetical protein
VALMLRRSGVDVLRAPVVLPLGEKLRLELEERR